MSAADRRIVLNIVLFGVLGVLVCWWFGSFTDLLPAIGGLLGLGGVFAWLAFVSKVLREDRIKLLQEGFEKRFLASRLTTTLLIAVLAVLAVVASMAATIQIEAVHEPFGRQVRISRPDKEPLRSKTLPASGRVRFPVVQCFWSAAPYEIKVAGYPAVTVTPTMRAKNILVVPADFYRSAVIFKPTAKLTTRVRRSPAVLVIKVDDAVQRVEGFEGQTVWVGCDEDVELPPAVVERWREESDYHPGWTTPLSAFGAGGDLKPGATIEVALETTEVAKNLATVTVEDYKKTRRFPQEVRLESD